MEDPKDEYATETYPRIHRSHIRLPVGHSKELHVSYQYDTREAESQTTPTTVSPVGVEVGGTTEFSGCAPIQVFELPVSMSNLSVDKTSSTSTRLEGHQILTVLRRIADTNLFVLVSLTVPLTVNGHLQLYCSRRPG